MGAEACENRHTGLTTRDQSHAAHAVGIVNFSMVRSFERHVNGSAEGGARCALNLHRRRHSD